MKLFLTVALCGLAGAAAGQPRVHVLDPAPKTVHIGFFDATLSPVLEVDSGDTVRITVLCPSFFKTNLLETMRSSDARLTALAEAAFANSTMSADEVAAAALRAVERGQLYCLPMRDARIVWRLKRLIPQRFARLVASRRLQQMAQQRAGVGAPGPARPFQGDRGPRHRNRASGRGDGGGRDRARLGGQGHGPAGARLGSFLSTAGCAGALYSFESPQGLSRERRKEQHRLPPP